MNNLFRSLRKKAPSANNERNKTPVEKKKKNNQTQKTKDSQEQHLSSSSTVEAPQPRRGPLHLFHRNDHKKTNESTNRKVAARTPALTRRQLAKRNASPASATLSPSQKTAAKSPSEGDRRLTSASTPQAFVPEETDPLVQQALTQKASSISEAARVQINLAVKALDRAGNALFEKGDYDAAFLRYERSLWLKQKTVEDEAPSRKHSEQDKSVMAAVATSINNMTYLKQRSGKAIVTNQKEILGPDHLSVGKTLNNIGSVFYMSREFEAALTAYRDAFRILKKHLGENHLDAVTVVSNIADVQAAMGDKDGALLNYRKALALRWNELGSQDTKVVRLMEQVARLETGEQPRGRMDDETEIGFASQEEMREEAVFMEDLRELQHELDEDMKYFDLVERQMAIDMLRDRTQMIREMRALEQQQEEAAALKPVQPSAVEQAETFSQLDQDDGTECSGLIEGLAAFELPSLDQFLNEDNPQVKMIQQEAQLQVNTITGDKPAPGREDLSNVSQEEVCEDDTIGRDRTSLATRMESSLYAVVKIETTFDKEELGTTISVTSDSDDTNGSDEDHVQTDESDGQMNTRTEQHTSKNEEPKRFSVTPRLTPSERRTALVSVQSRLEELRAKRGLLPASKVTIPTEHRAYMDQTASSVAKSTPCRKHSVQNQTVRTNAETAGAN